MTGLLVVHATARELPWGAEVESLEVGVGPARAAARLAARLASGGDRPERVLILGVAGAFPVRHRGGATAELAVGSAALVATERFGDLGKETPAGFVDLTAMGLATDAQWTAEQPRSAELAAELGLPAVAAVTVSCCSGTEERSAAVASRSGGAILESMEGAALALTCAEAGIPWLQLRAVSNATGEPDRAGWDLDAAVQTLEREGRRLLAALQAS